jgi:hypothetical protein
VGDLSGKPSHQSQRLLYPRPPCLVIPYKDLRVGFSTSLARHGERAGSEGLRKSRRGAIMLTRHTKQGTMVPSSSLDHFVASFLHDSFPFIPPLHLLEALQRRVRLEDAFLNPPPKRPQRKKTNHLGQLI